ncbi:hypothetical protein JCGZ_19833 [Jatropha curcas]|uniref:Glucose-methanol-choline oxidoreductase N-terminal domain-containing protein n=1 Tax=Jatropha curcas TaxID=180498 RepID=A0A067K652_JATCU|nr:(R)-mandelonitrile lyase-like [Jatropha curcas]KDP27710.1 hypothetical protein JCGZ_19833 [Jatropha curcas]
MESFISFFYIAFLMIVCTGVCHARLRPQAVPSYLKFVKNGTEFPSEEYYDYIVVGGGTAGCPLAASLSQWYRVLVLERGGVSHGKPNLMSQEGFLATLTQVDAFDSPAQAFTSEDGVPNARGRTLGGSSAINAGFYSRADPEFFAKSGVNWDLGMVNESYEWVEKAIVFRPVLRKWQSAFKDGLLEAGIDPYNGFSLNHLMGTKIGGSTFDATGARHTAADLLNYANPANIEVALYASVERVLLASTSSYLKNSKTTAIGVVYRDHKGQYHHAMVRENGEVILSAGAIGSPQLLLLSGIGPRHYLSSWGIPVSYNLPTVGQYMYDNPRNSISFVPSIPLEHSLIEVVGITKVGAYLEAASNVIPFASPARSIFINTPFSAPLYLTVATLMEKITGPLSTGSLRLASVDVRVNPTVRFNYFSNPVDLEKCVNGTRKIGDVLRSSSMQVLKFNDWFGGRSFRFVGPQLPSRQSDYMQMADFCKRSVSTIWHYHGGCVIGKVVDPHHRVFGIAALRVVDGSTFSISPGTNPQATLMMLGRYVGLKIMRDRMRY